MSKIHLVILIIIFLLSKEISLFAQSDYIIESRELGMKDGLIDKNISCFYQDKDGFIWLATPKGISRYDGYQFKHFSKKNAGFSYSRTSNIVQDSNGRLWLTHSDSFYGSGKIISIDIFTPNTKQTYQIPSDKLPFDIQHISRMRSDKEGNIWFSTLKGEIFKSDALLNISQEIRLPDGREVVDFMFNEKNEIWIASEKEIIVYDLSNNKKIISYPQDCTVGTICGFDPTGRLWYKSYDNTKIEKEQTAIFRNHLGDIFPSASILNKESYIHLFVPRLGQVWYYNTITKRLTISDLFGKSIFSKSINVKIKSHSDFTIDNEGSLWSIGSSSKSDAILSILKLSASNFKNYKPNPDDITSIVSFQSIYMPSLTTISKQTFSARGIWADSDQNRMIVSGSLGTFTFDLKTQAIIDKPTIAFVSPNYTFLSLAILKDRKGAFWFTNEYNWLLKYRDSSKVGKFFRIAPLEQQPLTDQKINTIPWCLYEDNNNVIWIGTKSGLICLDTVSGLFERPSFSNNHSYLGKSNIFCFHKSEQGVWLATSTGLFLIDLEDQKILQHFHEKEERELKLPHNIVLHIYEENDTTFWLATNGGGLIKWNPVTGASEQYTTQEGLSSNTIYAVYSDKQGYLWLSSNKGIMRFQTQTGGVNIFLPKDGLINEEFNTISHYQDHKGNIYFGGLNGVTVFHPDSIQINVKPLNKVKTTALQIQNRNTGDFIEMPQRSWESGVITLQPTDLGFRMKMSALSYLSPELIRYSYKIEGINNKYSYLERPELVVNSLPYGTYTLWLKAEGHLGNTSAPTKNIIKVLRPFYLQIWFLFTLSILLVGGIASIIYWRFKRIEKAKDFLENEVKRRTQKIEEDKKVIQEQTKKLEKLDKTKSQLFANVSHELRTPLTLILGPAERILKEEEQKLSLAVKQDLNTIQRNGKQLKVLVDEILMLSKIDAQKFSLQKNDTNLHNLIKRVVAYFDGQARYSGIQFQVENQVATELFAKLDGPQIERVIINLLSNAFKFSSEGGLVKLSCQLENNQFVFSVTDNGIGIHAESLPYIFDRYYQSDSGKEIQGGTGIGLALCKELLTLMDGKIEVTSHLNEGATFVCTIPVESFIKEKESAISNPLPTVVLPTKTLTIAHLKKEEKATILLAEDNNEMSNYIQSILDEMYEVLAFPNGKELLNYLSKYGNSHISMVISDLMMPVLDGITLLQKMKAHQGWQKIPFILLTAKASENDKIHALRIGVDDYLTKPFSSLELEARIANLIHHYENRKSWKEEGSLIPEEISNHDREHLANENQEWIQKLEKEVKNAIQSKQLTVNIVADNMAISERQFQRKVKQLIGMTPKKYFQEVQMQLAREALENGNVSSTQQLAAKLGFKNAHYFSTQFQNRFGTKPNYYLEVEE